MFTAKKILSGLTAAAIIGGATAAYADVDSVSITAKDQTLADNAVLAERVVAEQDGWLVLYSVKNDGNGFAGVDQVIGYTHLDSGVNENVLISPTQALESGERVVMMLHTDKTGDIPNEFEYMTDSQKDGPFMVDDYVTMLVVKVK